MTGTTALKSEDLRLPNSPQSAAAPALQSWLGTWPTARREFLPRRPTRPFDHHTLPQLIFESLPRGARHFCPPNSLSQRYRWVNPAWPCGIPHTHRTDAKMSRPRPPAQFGYSWGCDVTSAVFKLLYKPGGAEDWVPGLVSLSGRLVSRFPEDLTCKPRLCDPYIGLASAP